MLGAGIATQIRCLVASKNMRRLADGPVGGSPLYFGDDRVGYALDAPLPPAGEWAAPVCSRLHCRAGTRNPRIAAVKVADGATSGDRIVES